MTSAAPNPYGVQLSTQPRCKCCKASGRELLELHWGMRVAGDPLDGRTLTVGWMVANSAKLYGVGLSETNMRAHFGTAEKEGHFAVTTGAQEEAARQAVVANVDDELSPEAYLRGVVAAAGGKLKVSPEKVTHEMGLAAARILTQKGQGDAQNDLMRMLAMASSPTGRVTDGNRVYTRGQPGYQEVVPVADVEAEAVEVAEVVEEPEPESFEGTLALPDETHLGE